jgi:hypothetical protein
MTDRKKPGVAFWATVVTVVVLVAYPLSFGPACWRLSMSRPSGSVAAPRIYCAIGWLAANGPSWSRDAIFWYATRGQGNKVSIPVNWDDTVRTSMWSAP